MKTNVKKWMINGVYVISAVLAGIYILINILTLVGAYGFEYYGYDQWPWFYQSPVTLVRFAFTEIVVMVLCLYAMKKYHKTNMPIALLASLVPLALFAFSALMSSGSY